MTRSPTLPAARRPAHPGLVAGTRVLTAAGIVAVEFLSPGDRIITRDAGMVRLVDLVFRPCRGDFLQVRAGAFDVSRPETDTIIAAEQTVLLRGQAQPGQAETGGTGQSARLVSARELAGLRGCSLLRGIEMTVVRMIFDTPHLVYADGLETLCLPEGAPSLVA